MDSSPGFGSSPCHLGALFRLAFAPPPALLGLKLATQTNSSAHSSIGTPSHPSLDAPTACKRTVSGSISLPFRGSFHLSLTVLVRYRSPTVLSLGAWSPQIPTEFHVLRGTQVPLRSQIDFVYGTVTRSGRPSQVVRLSINVFSPRPAPPKRPRGPSTRHDAWGWRP